MTENGACGELERALDALDVGKVTVTFVDDGGLVCVRMDALANTIERRRVATVVRSFYPHCVEVVVDGRIDDAQEMP